MSIAQMMRLASIVFLLGLGAWLAAPGPWAYGQSQTERPEADDREPARRVAIRFLTENDFPPFNYLDEDNVLTGFKRELIPVLAGHADVDALDTWGVPDDLRTDVDLLAADDVKRVLRRPTTVAEARFDWLDDRAAERPEWIAAFLEMKTVWHPIGV